MASLTSIVLVWMSVATVTRAQIYIGLGYCPKHDPMNNFSEKNFLGTWYEVASTPNSIEALGRYVTFDFTKRNATIDVDLAMEVPSLKTHRKGNMVPTNESAKNGEYILTFENATYSSKDFSWYGFSAPLMVLDTDYKTYATIWSCEVEEIRGVNMTKHMAWILGRTKELTDEMYKKASFALIHVDVFPYQLKYTIQCSGAARFLLSFLCAILSFSVLRFVI